METEYSIYDYPHVDGRNFLVNKAKLETEKLREIGSQSTSKEPNEHLNTWQEKVQQDNQQTKNASIQQSK